METTAWRNVLFHPILADESRCGSADPEVSVAVAAALVNFCFPSGEKLNLILPCWFTVRHGAVLREIPHCARTATCS